MWCFRLDFRALNLADWISLEEIIESFLYAGFCGWRGLVVLSGYPYYNEIPKNFAPPAPAAAFPLFYELTRCLLLIISPPFLAFCRIMCDFRDEDSWGRSFFVSMQGKLTYAIICFSWFSSSIIIYCSDMEFDGELSLLATRLRVMS